MWLRSLGGFFAFCLASAFSMFGGITSQAEEAKPITLYLNLLPHRLTGDSELQYDLLLSEILPKITSDVVIERKPLLRAAHNFVRNEKSCLFPTNPSALKNQMQIESVPLTLSFPIDIVSLRLYVRHDFPEPVIFENIAANRIGFIQGSVVPKMFGARGNSFKAIETESLLLRMLDTKRIDAFVGHHPDTVLAIDQFSSSEIKVISLGGQFELPIHFICHERKAAEILIGEVNERILALHNSGRLLEILGPHADIPAVEEFLRNDPDS